MSALRPDDMPPIERAILEPLYGLESSELLVIARSRVTKAQQRRCELLLRKDSLGTISPEEKVELRELGDMADQLTLKKAYAYALLCERGEEPPELARWRAGKK